MDDAGAYEGYQTATDGGTPAITDVNGTVIVLDGGGTLMKVNCPVNATLIYSSYSSDGTNLGLYAPTYKPPQALLLKKQ